METLRFAGVLARDGIFDLPSCKFISPWLCHIPIQRYMATIVIDQSDYLEFSKYGISKVSIRLRNTEVLADSG